MLIEVDGRPGPRLAALEHLVTKIKGYGILGYFSLFTKFCQPRTPGSFDPLIQV
jgi:hypothetical protein